MRRLVLAVVIPAFAAISSGCGADAKEEAQAAATGDVLAQAPPNAVGADVPRPAGTLNSASDHAVGPTNPKIKPKAPPPPADPLADPEEPVVPPPPTTIPKKGTNL